MQNETGWTDARRGCSNTRAVSSDAPVTETPKVGGGHINAGDPLLTIEPRIARALYGRGFSDVPRSAHINAGDPLLSIENRALHALTVQTSPDEEPWVSSVPPMWDPLETPPAALGAAPVKPHADFVQRAPAARARARRRWKLVPLVGAAAAAVVLGGGTAVAFLSSPSAHGSGNSAPLIAGGAVSVGVTATTGTDDLLPGTTAAAYFTLHNATTASATFDTVAAGATVVSDNTSLCGNAYVRIAPSLPDTLPTPVTVGAGDTSGTQSVPGLVALAADAPSTCQGVMFTVTLSLSGESS